MRGPHVVCRWSLLGASLLALLAPLTSCNARQSGPHAVQSANPALDARVTVVASAATEGTMADSSNEGDRDCPAALVSARKGGGTPGRYVVPSEANRAALGSVVEALLAPSPDRERAATLAAGAGYEVVDAVEVPGAVVVREAGPNRGGGAYLIRLASSSHLLVEAPHTFFDAGTFPLACGLFARSHARALFINTVHRYKGAPEVNGKHPADVAHNETAAFHAATLAALRAIAPLTVIQVHGYAPGEGKGRVVISTGERHTGNAFLKGVQGALNHVLGDGVLRYPDDTKDLGATNNVQGAAVRERGGRFLHMELEEPTRRALLGNVGLRTRLFDALTPLLTEK